MKQKIDCNWNKYVDLGLPSGLLWETCNVGAKEPWENGLYFSWGNVDGHKKDSGYDFSETKYATTPGSSLTGNIPVNAEYDAARANLGGSWRMPTAFEFKELYDNCTNVWPTQDGVYGRLFISGRYWSSSIVLQTYVQYLCLHNKNVSYQHYSNRTYGFTVRAVLDHPKDSLMIRTIKR